MAISAHAPHTCVSNPPDKTQGQTVAGPVKTKGAWENYVSIIENQTRCVLVNYGLRGSMNSIFFCNFIKADYFTNLYEILGLTPRENIYLCM